MPWSLGLSEYLPHLLHSWIYSSVNPPSPTPALMLASPLTSRQMQKNAKFRMTHSGKWEGKRTTVPSSQAGRDRFQDWMRESRNTWPDPLLTCQLGNSAAACRLLGTRTRSQALHLQGLSQMPLAEHQCLVNSHLLKVWQGSHCNSIWKLNDFKAGVHW